MHPGARFRYVRAMLALLFSALVVAEPLGFEAALAFAERVPEVEADRQAQAARSELGGHVSRLTYNPLVQVQPGYRRTASGARGAEVYVNVYQRISLTGAGKERQAAVRAEEREDTATLGLARTLARRRIAQAWLLRWAAQAARREAVAEVAIARDLRTRTERTLAAGEATRVDVATIDTWAAEAELFALGGEGEAFDTGVALAESLGRPELGAQPVHDDAPEIPLPDELTAQGLHAATASSAAAVAARRVAESEQARLHEVKAVRGPSFAIGGMGWREGTGDVAGVGTLELEIPVFERGERERAAQSAAAARADGRALGAAQAEAARRTRLAHELGHSRAVLDVLDTRFVRAAEELASAQEKRLIAREATAQDWVIARQKLLRARIDAVRARAQHLLVRFLVAEAHAEGRP